MEPTGEALSKCAKESGNSDENLELFCDPCQTEGGNLPAEGYCVECHEYLCTDCHRVHRRLAATKGHTVQQKELMPKQRPESALKSDTCMPEICPTHADQPIDYYCTSHKDICCVVCKSKRHVDCKDVKIISDMLNYVDIEHEYSIFKRKMKTLVCDADNTQEQVETSLNAIELNYEIAHTSKCELRKAVNDHLDQIERGFDEKLYSLSKEDLKRIVSYRNKCHATKVDTNAMEVSMESKMKSNKCQLFSAMKKAEIKLKLYHDELANIRCNNKLTRYYFKPEQTVVNLKTANSFGEIVVRENAVKSHKQLVVLNTKSENNGKCLISGLVLLSKDHLIAVDNKNKSVKMIHIEEDRIVSEMMLESSPWDAAAINNTQIVVTVPEAKTLTFVTVNENKCLEMLNEKLIHVSGECYGVTLLGGKLIVCMMNPAKLEMYNYNGKVLFSLNVDASSPQYVTLNTRNSMLYMSNKADGYNANIQEFCYRKASTSTRYILPTKGHNGVFGMAIDKTGCLYYCRAYHYDICTVSIDKELNSDTTSKCLVEKSSNLPQCLTYCNDTNRLFVGMDGDNIVVYYVV